MSTALVTPSGTSAPNTRKSGSMFGAKQLIASTPGALRKLDPRSMWRNPVKFVVQVGAALTTALAIAQPLLDSSAQSTASPTSLAFTGSIAIWLWLTVLFANLAEAVAEGRGKAQARSLRESRTSTMATLVDGYDEVGDPGAERTGTRQLPSAELTLGDTVVVAAGELIPGDGDIVWGIASVDESAITGESAPVVRESGGDRSAVTGGTRVLSDRIVMRITSRPGETFVDRMIALVEGASRQKTPNEIALNILLASLIPTTIGALLSAIGIAGMDRLVQHNVLALSGRAVEAAGDVTILLLDKTGTITYGNRQAAEFSALAGVAPRTLAEAASAASLSDPTPEGKSILELAVARGFTVPERLDGTAVPFTAQTRMSGVDYTDGSQLRKGAGSMVIGWAEESGELRHGVAAELDRIVTGIAEASPEDKMALIKREQEGGNLVDLDSDPTKLIDGDR